MRKIENASRAKRAVAWPERSESHPTRYTLPQGVNEHNGKARCKMTRTDDLARSPYVP